MEEPCAPPPLSGPVDADGWRSETCRYRVFARPKHKFKTTLDAKVLFGPQGQTEGTITTRVRDHDYELEVDFRIRGARLHDVLRGELRPGLVARHLVREATEPDGFVARRHEVWFDRGPYDFPETTYPEVMLPFIMRAQPFDKKRRALFSWTNDGFCARVYYENRKRKTIHVPAGTFETREVWMYPDLNDWVSMGAALTRLAKPLLPRYTMWFEIERPHRAIRFEGPYGPPGAPEVVVELLG